MATCFNHTIIMYFSFWQTFFRPWATFSIDLLSIDLLSIDLLSISLFVKSLQRANPLSVTSVGIQHIIQWKVTYLHTSTEHGFTPPSKWTGTFRSSQSVSPVQCSKCVRVSFLQWRVSGSYFVILTKCCPLVVVQRRYYYWRCYFYVQVNLFITVHCIYIPKKLVVVLQ